MPWKFVGNLWCHEVLQTTIVRQITKEMNKSKKLKKQSKTIGIV